VWRASGIKGWKGREERRRIGGKVADIMLRCTRKGRAIYRLTFLPKPVQEIERE